jgi:hypothetical protein
MLSELRFESLKRIEEYTSIVSAFYQYSLNARAARNIFQPFDKVVSVI